MLGQITALLIEIRDAIKHGNKLDAEWRILLMKQRQEDEQRRKDEDSIMKRYLDLMQAANEEAQRAAQPIDKQAIYNEMERERKARARDRKSKGEENTSNG